RLVPAGDHECADQRDRDLRGVRTERLDELAARELIERIALPPRFDPVGGEPRVLARAPPLEVPAPRIAWRHTVGDALPALLCSHAVPPPPRPARRFSSIEERHLIAAALGAQLHLAELRRELRHTRSRQVLPRPKPVERLPQFRVGG